MEFTIENCDTYIKIDNMHSFHYPLDVESDDCSFLFDLVHDQFDNIKEITVRPNHGIGGFDVHFIEAMLRPVNDRNRFSSWGMCRRKAPGFPLI